MKIRRVNCNDFLDILNWRNDPLTISMSVNTSKISYDQHLIWFNNVLKDPFKTLYIGEFTNSKAGVCRFDYDPQNSLALVSINLNPIMRGKRISIDLLNSAIIEYRRYCSAPLMAEIKRNNYASIKIFERCNFQICSESDDYFFYELI
jgi:RimJ/RimL family protein N-acetyltransferase